MDSEPISRGHESPKEETMRDQRRGIFCESGSESGKGVRSPGTFPVRRASRNRGASALPSVRGTGFPRLVAPSHIRLMQVYPHTSNRPTTPGRSAPRRKSPTTWFSQLVVGNSALVVDGSQITLPVRKPVSSSALPFVAPEVRQSTVSRSRLSSASARPAGRQPAVVLHTVQAECYNGPSNREAPGRLAGKTEGFKGT